MEYRVINVGTHANPPGDMYERYFPAELRHLAPRFHAQREFPGEGLFDCMELEGKFVRQLPTQVGTFTASLESIPYIHSFDEGYAGQRDPIARLADMDADGIDADIVVHPGYPILLPSNRETRWGMMAAFNDWLAEFCSAAPERLFGIGEVPLWDIPRAVEEARRIAALGLKGVLMPAVPGYVGAWSSPADAPYTDARYKPLWAVLEELGLTMVVHADAAAATPGLQDYDQPAINLIINKTLPSEMIASLIVGHVFRDYQGLKLVCVETGVGWMAHLVAWMDVLVREHPTLYIGLHELPSETFRKHVGGSFLWDTIGIANRDVIGIDSIMWCSDYPHSYGPFPNSQEKITEALGHITDAERHRVLSGNAQRFFNIE
jgi:predicted TIM-barrel fold metal-dependent hydrolase